MGRNWNGFWTILLKEVIDNLRDRRTLTTIAVSISVSPILLFGFLWFTETTVKNETDPIRAAAVELAVQGSDLAPNLMDFLQRNNVHIVDRVGDVEAAVARGEYRVALVIEAHYTQAYMRSETAPLRLIYDSSASGFEQLSFGTVQRLIQQYSQTIGRLRLLARGVDPNITQVIQVNVSDVAPPASRNTEILMMLPYLIVIFIMVGGMYLAIDTTAGERENGSLESLVIQPVDRRVILLAKLFATALFSALTLLLMLIGLALALNYVPLDLITIHLNVERVMLTFVVCLPFVLLAASALVLMASFTKSYKEAQSYLSLLMLLPSLPLILVGMLSPRPSVANMWVPSLSHGLMIVDIFRGEPIATSLILLSMFATTGFAAVLAWVAMALYQRERLLG